MPELASDRLTPTRSVAATHEQRVSLALAAGRTGVWSWDPQTGVIDFDHRIATIWGVKDDAGPTKNDFIESVHAEDRSRVSKDLADVIAGRVDADGDDIEFRIARFDDGKERWLAVRGQAFFDEAGQLVELIGTARDITDHKLHDIHLHMLLREITHRSKNLLAIIQAMARQTVKDSLTADDFEHRLSLRLRGLASSHELLAAQDWHGAHIEELVKGQLGHVLESYAPRIAFNGPSLFLKPEAAQNIGLALNELATNAVRYGALSNDRGRIEIVWAVDEPPQPGRRLHITWSELNGPTVAPPRRQGFGHRVVERVAARALDGSVSLTFAPAGLKWSLDIPVSFVLSGQPANSGEMPRFF